ncbi:MAG TPA: hypothetical protein VGV59_07150, partial [Pyrinomonadaceae bacterium]|nr:hypothetical protein [Pyrinomonadaceae bacterium]
MNAQDSTPHHQRRTLTTTVLICFLTLSIVGIASRAQDSTISNKEEREFKSTIPEHVPIRVKVRNEQALKQMDNEKWARELEIEVKNTGSKPIYYLSMSILMPEMTDAYNRPLTFQVRYGRKELRHLDTQLQPDDVPIRAGESATLKISENQVKGFEVTRHKEKVSNPKKIEFWLIVMNLGDGTGFSGRDGSPEAYLTKELSTNILPPAGKPEACKSPPTVRKADSSVKLINALYSPQPANFLRVDFSPPLQTALAAAPLLPCNCRNDNDCMWGEFGPPSPVPFSVDTICAG